MRALVPLLLLLAASACGDRPEDDGRGEIPAVPVRAVDEDGRVMLSPAESAAAVRAAEEHSRRLSDSVRAAAGVPAAPPPPPAAPSTRPSPSTYAECMAQVAAAEGDEAEVWERICPRLPGAP